MVPVEVTDREAGREFGLSFTPESTDASYLLGVWWNGFPLPMFPLRFTAVSEVGGERERNRVVLSGRGLREAKCDVDSNFFIDGSQVNLGIYQT